MTHEDTTAPAEIIAAGPSAAEEAADRLLETPALIQLTIARCMAHGMSLGAFHETADALWAAVAEAREKAVATALEARK